jgi:two-component system response regulator AtoC
VAVRKKGTILIAEDEPEVRNYLEMALRCQGYAVELTENGEEALATLKSLNGEVSLILLDVMMPRMDGIETLRQIRATKPDLPVIMLTGVTATSKVVEAMKSGATDYLQKPISHGDLDAAIRKALSLDDNGAPQELETPAIHDIFVAGCWGGKKMPALLKLVSASDVPVLIEGETGVGKEVLARQIHNRSPRAGKPFLKLNCAALPSELVESELFGYERGAFTGAFKNKPGRFEMAEGGTILLDEIGDMDFKLQAKLLHVLQDQEFERLGGKERVRVNVRVFAATHRNLLQAIEDGCFREDLYYRLAVINLAVPPLRERTDELLPLAECLLRKHTPPGDTVPSISPALRSAMLAYRWPGNIRELENVVRKLIVLRDPDQLAQELEASTRKRNGAGAPGGTRIAIPAGSDTEPHSTTAASSAPEPEARRATGGRSESILEKVQEVKLHAERVAILAALDRTHWNRKQAAMLLKIDYKALLYKMRKLSIEEIASQREEVAAW